MTPEILPLDQVGAADRERVGGKATNLGVVIRAGLSVPAGFCITTDAFRRFLAGADVSSLLPQLDGAKADDVGAQERLGAALRQRLEAAPLPFGLTDAILSAWDDLLSRCPCAVRSSATAEDLPDASFAGQQDTILDVRTADDLLRAVRECWISLYSDRALAYRSRNGIGQARVHMAVIVQRFVPADAAGAMFTRNPLPSDGPGIIIEATRGVGDALVSGRVTPDRFVVDRDAVRVTRRVLATAAVASVSDTVAERLAQLGLESERVFGTPQDVEWALMGDELFLLQSRPITTGKTSAGAETDHQVWSNMNVGEILPDVISPLTWSLLNQTMLRLLNEVLVFFGFDLQHSPLIGRIGGRVYFNINTIFAVVQTLPTRKRFDLGTLFGGMHGDLTGASTRNALEGHLPQVRLSRLKALRRLPVLFGWAIRNHSTRRADCALASFAHRVDVLRGRARSGLSSAVLLAELDRGVETFDAGLKQLLGPVGVGTNYFNMLDTMCTRWFRDEPRIANQLLTGVGGMASADAGLDMWRLAALAHDDRDVERLLLAGASFADTRSQLALTPGGQTFLASWDIFMTRHGHHARGELELTTARWSEEPGYVLGQVRSYLGNMDETNPVAAHERQALQCRQRARAVRQRLKGPAQRLTFDLLLRRAQRGLVFRENAKNEMVRLLAHLRTVASELGGCLARDGVLRSGDDVFFLDLDELRRLVAGTSSEAARDLITQRRSEHERNQRLTPPAVVTGRGEALSAASEAAIVDGDRLIGVGVSPGLVTGTARVILRANTDERVLPGEVLVAPFTDPGWTPYFQLAAALVTDLGGLLSHGSIIAREYGLPAVVNVAHATRLIRTGDRIQVDGTRGEVQILRGEDGSAG